MSSDTKLKFDHFKCVAYTTLPRDLCEQKMNGAQEKIHLILFTHRETERDYADQLSREECKGFIYLFVFILFTRRCSSLHQLMVASRVISLVKTLFNTYNLLRQ